MTVLAIVLLALVAVAFLLRFVLRDFLARRTGTRLVTSVPLGQRGEADDDR